MRRRQITYSEVFAEKFDGLWKAEAYFSALVALGTRWDARSQGSVLAQKRLEATLQQVELTPAVLDRVEEEALHRANRIAGILAVGERYDADEILLILTLREELDTVERLLRQVYGVDLPLSLAEIDQQIRGRFSAIPLKGASRKLFHRLYG